MSGGRLVLEGVTKRHARGARPALDDVDLVVEAGRTLALLGASGAGKTTLLRIVTGLEEADAGSVWIGERLVSDPRLRVPPERRGVGLVFQHLELWPHMSVAENIAFGLPGRPRGKAAEAHPNVRDLARRVDLLSLLGRSPATLSGGERQRVAIARSLAPQPAVLLYDEPLANLDPERRRDVRRLIRTLAREAQTTLVYVTHDADEAMEMGDEIAVLHAGRLVDRGSPVELYRHPSTLASARALGPVTALEADLVEGRAHTALGDLSLATAAPPGPGLVLLRPELVRLGAHGRWPAEVVSTHPAGATWRVRARIGEVEVEGHAAEPAAVGSRLHVAIQEPVVAVPRESP